MCVEQHLKEAHVGRDDWVVGSVDGQRVWHLSCPTLEMVIDCDMYLSLYKVVVLPVVNWIISWAHPGQYVPLLKASAASVAISRTLIIESTTQMDVSAHLQHVPTYFMQRRCCSCAQGMAKGYGEMQQEQQLRRRGALLYRHLPKGTYWKKIHGVLDVPDTHFTILLPTIWAGVRTDEGISGFLL